MVVVPWRKSSMDEVGLVTVTGWVVEFLGANWITSSCKCGNISVLRETENKNGTAKKGISHNTEILTHLQMEVIQSAQRNFTTQPRTAALSHPWSSSSTIQRPWIIHHGTVRLPPHYEKCRMQCIQCTPLLGTIHIGPGPQPNCRWVALLRTLLSTALFICTSRINISPCYTSLWARSRHKQRTHCMLYSYPKTRRSTTRRRPI